jgi:4-hydroxy-tetrahydrodipicolinate reductase
MAAAPLIPVVVAGAAGRMGRETLNAVAGEPDMRLVGAVDRVGVGAGVRELTGSDSDLSIELELRPALERAKQGVLVDFTDAAGAPENALASLNSGVAPVIGTTGLSGADIERIRESSESRGVPAMIVANFAIGAVLMMRFAEEAARWLPHAEIVEMHHDAKRDAPSGTAMSTARRIAMSRGESAAVPPTQTLKVEGARGGLVDGVPVHSVRLRGLVAHQIVLFGGQGETLSIRHDSMDRSSFMPGVLLAIRNVWRLSGLVIGLDALLFDGDA